MKDTLLRLQETLPKTLVFQSGGNYQLNPEVVLLAKVDQRRSELVVIDEDGFVRQVTKNSHFDD